MQRIDRIGRGLGFMSITLALLVVLGSSLRALPELRTGQLSNPDTWMRLVRLRDMLNSGAVFDTVARDGSGHGTVLHWSHLLDSLLYLLVPPFSLVWHGDDALRAAALAFGPLNVAALSFAIIWAAAPFADRKWLWLGAVLAPLSPSIISYGVAGVVHHHIAVDIAAVACWGWAARLIAGRAPAWAGVPLGAWIAVGIWFTPESTPLTLLAFAALGFTWIIYPARDDVARASALSGLSFALVTLLALAVDPPEAGIAAVEIDRLSVLFAGLALAVAATGIGLWAAHGRVRSVRARFAAACLIGLLCAGVWAWSYRTAIFSANMLLDAEQRNAMFGSISEMMPVDGVLLGLHFLLTGSCAALLAGVLAVRRRSPLLGFVALCLVVLTVLGGQHVRFAAHPEAAGAIALPIALTLATTGTSHWHQIGQSFVRLAIILLFVQVPYVGMLPALTSTARAEPFGVLPACRASDAVGMLRSYPGAVVLADVSDTPELLWKTQVRTVGSLYHRDMAGFMRLRDAWRVAPSATVPPEIDAAEVDLVLGCRTSARSALVVDLPGPTLLDEVRTGNPPPWLRQIDENPVSGHVLYEVVRPRQEARGTALTEAIHYPEGAIR